MTSKTTTPEHKTRPTAQSKEEALAIVADRPPCLCGCGGYPKGKKARFVPGHDARYHSAQKKARLASALRDDELRLTPVAEWHAPTDRDGFLAFLREAGVDLETFKTYPVWQFVPADLEAALAAPVPANPPDRAPSPPRRRAAKGNTTESAGSKATVRRSAPKTGGTR
jgi:hypothetical protein